MMLSTLPAWILAGFAASLTVAGMQGSWLLPAASPLLRWALAIALHGAWLLPELRRRSPFAGVVCWALCLWFCRRALDPASPRTFGALLLEGIPLLLLLPPSTWTDRLARWRRAQSAISSQLRLTTGLLPWFRGAAAAFLNGPVRPPSPADELSALNELDQRAGDCETLLQELLNHIPKSPNGDRS